MSESYNTSSSDALGTIGIRKEQLEQYGIHGASEVIYNPSYDQLYEEELRPELEGFERGQVTDSGAINVMTGIYTGRSPKDKWIVKDETTKDRLDQQKELKLIDIGLKQL